MKYIAFARVLLTAISLFSSAAGATTLYVSGATGTDTNNSICTSSLPCMTLGHAISVASAGSTIVVAAGTYKENLRIVQSLKIIGSGANATIVDGGGTSTVITISSTTASVTLSAMTIRNGSATQGGGIYNSGILSLNKSIVTANHATVSNGSPLGGGIYNVGALAINNSTISANGATASGGSGSFVYAYGGGIATSGTLTINMSTISGNTATASGSYEYAYGGGIFNHSGTLTINNSTISGNTASLGIVNASGRAYGGGIANNGVLTIINSTLTGNSARRTLYTLSYGGGISGSASINNTTISGNSAWYGGGISGSATIQNSIIANNTSRNCFTSMTSSGYNLSSDGSCNFISTGDMNNTDPMLDSSLKNNGGPTLTIALQPGSPAIDAGNPGGCTDGKGNLLSTDQRGSPRPDPPETAGCDMGAYESQGLQ